LGSYHSSRRRDHRFPHMDRDIRTMTGACPVAKAGSAKGCVKETSFARILLACVPEAPPCCPVLAGEDLLPESFHPFREKHPS
jgi:hypothetical protein